MGQSSRRYPWQTGEKTICQGHLEYCTRARTCRMCFALPFENKAVRRWKCCWRRGSGRSVGRLTEDFSLLTLANSKEDDLPGSTKPPIPLANGKKDDLPGSIHSKPPLAKGRKDDLPGSTKPSATLANGRKVNMPGSIHSKTPLANGRPVSHDPKRSARHEIHPKKYISKKSPPRNEPQYDEWK